MPLEPGSRIGSYEVLARIGASGMGRFKREAQVLASLNHPHIAQIHGLEEQDGCAIVMELVDGETLDARLKPRAPALLRCEWSARLQPSDPADWFQKWILTLASCAT